MKSASKNLSSASFGAAAGDRLSNDEADCQPGEVHCFRHAFDTCIDVTDNRREADP
jgi:hypothetical protein